jgi:lipopolysaccharide transport system ATP-binding protein
MNEIAIQAENLKKCYHLGVLHQRHDTLRDAIVSAFKPAKPREEETIWALNNVSFEIDQGDVVGIIGRNGAGKTTVLKILSRITEPTEGKAIVKGRVGSLLEVGTGFHPELTGRENIYLNGAILGMRRHEIERKFDEIIAFAEIERFLDTPVKRYSSGMYVRLAFAVAAHLEPEILLVDEVLAVGDAAFQKRCLGKMGDVAREGRTVLFVSHNMVALQSLCKRAIWLDGGKLIEEGPAAQVVGRYLSASLSHSQASQVWNDPATAPGNEFIRLHRVVAHPENGSPADPITTETPMAVEIAYWNLVPDARLHVTLHFYTEQQIVAFTTGSSTTDPVWRGKPFPVGLYRSTCQVPGRFLNSGVVIYRHEDLLAIEVLDLAERRVGSWYGKEPGVLRPLLQWRTEQLDATPNIGGCSNA